MIVSTPKGPQEWTGVWPARRGAVHAVAVLSGTRHPALEEVGAQFRFGRGDYDIYLLPTGYAIDQRPAWQGGEQAI